MQEVKKYNGAGFIKFIRSNEAIELMKYPNAFVLLSLIVQRARRSEASLNEQNLELGEALIGDHLTTVMSEQQYRTAKMQLTRFKIITTRATNRGTIAKIIDTSVYDINIDEGNDQSNGQVTDKLTDSQRTGNDQAPTNEEVKNIRNEEIKEYCPKPNNSPYSLEQIAFALAEIFEQSIWIRKPDYDFQNSEREKK